jgi:hypothetical protein
MAKPSSQRTTAVARNPATASGFVARVRARGRLGTPLDWLLSLLLVVQLVGASASAGQALPDHGIQAPGASLSAVLGGPVPICLHGDPGDPAPSMPADCGHCTLCHVMAGVAALPAIPGMPVPTAIVAVLQHPRLSVPPIALRRGGSSSPRGPPSLA